MTPTDLQYRCIKQAADWFHNDSTNKQVLTFAGYAGTGKSTCLPHMIEEFGLTADEVQFCAPTGKAAKIMTEKLKQQGFEAAARTIHSSIYTPKTERAEVIAANLKAAEEAAFQAAAEQSHTAYFQGENVTLDVLGKMIAALRYDLDKAYVANDGPSFTLNIASEVYNRRLIVVDEGSMVGSYLAADLMAFGVPILVMGDPGQLPPVKDEAGFDLETPDLFLTEIHRQAADNPIIHLATLARQGEILKVGNYGDGRARVIRRRDDNVTYNMDEDVQVIVGTHKYRWDVTARIRKAAGYTSTAPTKGEPIICCRNSRRMPLVNGSTAVVLEGPEELEKGSPNFVLKFKDEEGVDRTAIVNQGIFEEHALRERNAFTCGKKEAYHSRRSDEHFDFGWAITCHKAQGSAWPNVVVHDESGMFREDASKWLYTAITRASERLTIVA